MLSREQGDRIDVAFDDHRLVGNAGLILPVALAHHLGLGELVDHHVDLGDAPGRANAGDKMLTLAASALAGGDCIDDADALEGLGGCYRFAQTDARGPACQVVGHHLHRQPGAVGGEASRGEMVEPDAVLEVSDSILDLGVAAMVGLQFQGVPVSVGDAAVIAVAGEEGQLGTGRGLHPPGDEPTGAASGSSWKGV